MINHQKTQQLLPFLVAGFIFTIFLGFSYFVSDPLKAGKIDRYILYNIDDIFRYCFVRASLQNSLIFLHPHVKPLYAIISSCFFRLVPLGMLSLRIMNSIFSAASIFILYKLMRKLKFENSFCILGILITLTVPLYFIISISTLSEIMFCFFLVLSICLFYFERYLFSTIFISLLPTIRQEGLLFLGVWVVFLLVKHRIRYVLFLFIPAFLWGALNYFILGHSFFFTFMYVPSITKDISVQLLPAAIKFLFTLSYPTLFLFLLGLIINLRNKENFLILVCFFIPFIAQIILNLIGFIYFPGRPSAKMRFMVPYIPLIAIVVTTTIKEIVQSLRKIKLIGCSLISIGLILATFQICQIKRLQEEPEAKDEFFSPEQEIVLKNTSIWLNEHAKRENINIVYIPADETIYKSLRRIWMYLSTEIKYYVVTPPRYASVVDVMTLKPVPHRERGILISCQKHEFADDLGYSLIKELPFISLYFYLIPEQKVDLF